MDAFSYLSVMLSIVLGLGLTQLFGGIGNMVRVRRRVEPYWLHTCWVFLLILLHLHMWWSFWALRGVKGWTWLTFVYIVIGPASLVIASHIIIPELIEGRIVVKRHYLDTSPLFFSVLCLAATWAMFLEPVIGLRAFFVPFRLLQAAGVVTFGACACSKDKRVHTAAIVVIPTLVAISVALTRFQIGQFNLR